MKFEVGDWPWLCHDQSWVLLGCGQMQKQNKMINNTVPQFNVVGMLVIDTDSVDNLSMEKNCCRVECYSFEFVQSYPVILLISFVIGLVVADLQNDCSSKTM